MNSKILLVMRNTYAWHGDHIESLRRMGLEIHLASQVPGAPDDGRFASVLRLSPEQNADEVVTACVARARELGIDTAITFYDTDIVLASRINAELGKAWAAPHTDEITRDKRRQRVFLAERGLPAPKFAPVSDVASGLAAAEGFSYPFIVKPSTLAASMGVSLVRDRDELERALLDIEKLLEQWGGYFPAGDAREIALLEEFLPGKEVTLDGVVLFGKFHLVGVTNKMQMPGPYFEEDFYTLPFRTPEEEPGLVAVVEGIVDGLGVTHCLFNAEFRQDADGTYRVVEFATRMSGGQNYRNLREVHGIDPVRLYTKALLLDDGTADAAEAERRVWDGEVRRTAPQAATCIKFAYRTGQLIRNNPGDVFHSPYFRSYVQGSKLGAKLRRAPEGWYEIAGSLAVAGPYREPADIDRIEEIAAELDQRLDVVVVPA